MKKTRSNQTVVPALAASCWSLYLLVPFSWSGEWWGAVWYLLNRPLSEIAKPLLFAHGVALYVGVVTLINVSIVYWLLWLVLRLASSRK